MLREAAIRDRSRSATIKVSLRPARAASVPSGEATQLSPQSSISPSRPQ